MALSGWLVSSPLGYLIAIALGICYTWLGIFLAAQGTGNWPVSFFIASISFGVYLPVRLLSPLWSGRRSRKWTAVPRQITPVADEVREQSQAVQTSRSGE